MDVGDYIVVLRYDPGTPQTYRVTDAPSAMLARKAVLAHLGYNPGVHISVREYKRWDTADYTIEYRPLTQEQEEAIRYND